MDNTLTLPLGYIVVEILAIVCYNSSHNKKVDPAFTSKWRCSNKDSDQILSTVDDKGYKLIHSQTQHELETRFYNTIP